MDRFLESSLSKRVDEYHKLGSTEGGKNSPSSESTAPDIHEVRAITDAKAFVNAEESAFSTAMTSADKQANDVEQRILSLDASCKAELGQDLVESTFRSALSKHEQKLVSTCVNEMRTRAALKGFQNRYGIQDPAHYPEDRLLHFAWLILFVALETGVNAFFYQNSAGLLGGATVALAVAVVNMGAAVLFGTLFRFANMPGVKEKLIGIGALIGFLLMGGVLNLIFSTFRVQYALVVETDDTAKVTEAFLIAVRDAFGVFAFHFPAIDFMSFILFWVGLGCSIVAFYKGYTYDDKFPGHGKLDRDHKSAAKIHDEEIENARASASAGLHEKEKEVETLRGSILAVQGQITSARAVAQSAQANFVSTTQNIQNELSLLIDAYRAANRASRASSQPTYFHEAIDVMPASDGSERLASVLKRIDEVMVRGKELSEAHRKSLGERILQIQKQGNELIAEGFLNHLAEIKKRAEAIINAQLNATHRI